MGSACVVQQGDPCSIHPPLLSPRKVARRPACQLGVAVLKATGSWAEGLALQVNLLTWWLWLATGGRGPSEEL